MTAVFSGYVECPFTIFHLFTTPPSAGFYFLIFLLYPFRDLHPTMSSIKTGASCMHISHQSNKYLKIVQNVFSMWDFLISRMANINISFQVIDCCLIYDIIRRLVDTFSEQDVELLLLVLKSTKYDLNCITLEVTSYLLPFIFLWSLEITPSSKMVSTFHQN